MARFSFPVPSRRQRGAPAPTNTPTPTAPQNKLRKVPSMSSQPGAWTTNPAPDNSRNWETQSSSCISITVTDSTISRDDNDAGASASAAGHHGLSSLTEGHVVNSTTTLRQPTFDGESGVLGNLTALHNNDRRSVTDASSLRRKQSSSTIVSYYDKSKVPLAISQQTSSSAMAKGLPSKARSLLDIDGTLANDAVKKKKRKPVGLDLSRVFAHRKANSSTASLSVEADRPITRGPATPKRSPSFLAATRLDYLARPRSSQRPDHDPRSTTQGSLRGRRSKAAGDAAQRNPTSLVHPAVMHDSGPGLEHLYNHYEQRTLRDIPARPDPLSETEAEEEETTPEPTPLINRPSITSDVRTNAHEPTKSDTDRYNRPYNAENTSLDTGRYPGVPSARHARHPQHTQPERDDDSGVLPFYKGNPSSVGGSESVDSRLAKPAMERGGLSALQLPLDVDCADSISSRHTRTSKASRRTSQSLVDSDLKQISMLSLSSDSEEDDVVEARPATSPSNLLSPNDTDTDTDTALGGSPSPYRSWTSFSPSASQTASSDPVNQGNSHARGNSQRRIQPIVDQPYSSTHHYVRPSASTTNQRTRSASLLTASTSKPSSRGNRDSVPIHSPSQSSRRSFASTHTSDSINASGYTVHEARAITMVPAQGASYQSAEPGHGPSSPSELGTPPLSPTSMDFLVHATRSPALDCEQGSIPSAGSSLRSSVYNLGSNGQAKWTGHGQGLGLVQGSGRLMAVTRQEELLLAALRKKRLRMRESIIAEFGEGSEREQATAPGSRGSIDAMMAGLRQSQPPSVSYGEPMQFDDSAFPRPPSSASTTSFGPPFGPLPASPSLGRPSSRAKRSSFGLVPSYTTPELLGDSDARDGRPSSRLSDRLDLDSRLDGSGGGEGEDRSSIRRHSTDSLGIPGGLSPVGMLAPSKRRYQPRLLAAPNGGRRRRSGGLLSQPGAAATAPWQSRSPVDEYPVRIVDDPAIDLEEMPVDQYDGGLVDKRPVDDGAEVGIPRPDSPVESAVPLPRKRAARISAVGTASMMGGGW